jgi:hypothetical protein
MPINNQKMLQSIYDTLFSGYVQPPDGANVQGASPDPKNVYLCLEWPGKQISEADLAGGWSPNNPKGNMEATENFSTLVDAAPSLFPMFTPTGRKVSETYATVTQANYTPPPPNPEQVKAFNDADAKLWKDGKDYDDTGAEITVKKPSPMYMAYKKAALAYNNELTKFMQLYLGYDFSDPVDQRKFATLGPMLRKPVDVAWDDWTAAKKNVIEDALAVLAQSSNNQIGRVFNEAQKRLEALKKAGLKEAGKTWYASYASPANWFAASAADEWTTATITSNKDVKNEHSDFQQISVQSSLNWGFFSGSGSFDKSDSHEHMDETTENLEMSFSYAKVDIDRPWLNALLFALQGWSLPDNPRGSFSDGTKTQHDTVFPLLPVAFVAVRNLTIKANWGKKDLDLIEKKLSSKASFGIGPFSVSGSYASGSTDKRTSSEFDGRTITSKGLQIVAWICAVNPLSPPKAYQPAPSPQAEPAHA